MTGASQVKNIRKSFRLSAVEVNI
jgi:hypothetical protein